MATNLITLDEYKDYAGIKSPNHDTEINSIIPKISALVKNYCGRTFVDYYTDPKIETSNGGSPYIYLKEAPVVQVYNVEYSSDYGITYTPYTYYVVDTEYDRLAPTASTEFPKSVNAFRITYTAGYLSTPEDLKLACLDLVTYYMKADMSIKSTRGVGSNQTSVEFITTSSLPSHIRRVLDMHRLEY